MRTTAGRSCGRRVCAGALIAALLGVAATAASGAPSDPRFFQQWGLKRIGAEFAWGQSTGAGVVIAVLDSGVDAAHPDLAGKVLAGRDFVSGDADPSDENGHGTMVAGIAAAALHNGVGISPVAPDASVLPARVIDQEGRGTTDDAAEAIRWSVEEARRLGRPLIINLSLDWPAPSGGALGLPVFYNDPEMNEAIRQATAAGAAVIVAAGNEGADRTPYDAVDAGVLVVGATDQSDLSAAFSNHGSGLDIVAPGVEIVSTYWDRQRGSAYGIGKGTSMSVAFVSGTAALLMARGMSNTQAIDRLVSTARDLGAPGRDDLTGHGLLDAAAALGAARSQSSPPPQPAQKPSAPLAPAAAPTASASPAQTPSQTPAAPEPSPQTPATLAPPPQTQAAPELPAPPPRASAKVRAAAQPRQRWPGPATYAAAALLLLVIATLLGRAAIIRERRAAGPPA